MRCCAQAKEKAVEPRLWKKTKAVERLRREYRTADELLADSAEKPSSAAQPILDMRGPQARLVTDMDSLNADVQDAGGDATPMPELQHNLQLLVDLAAAEIQRVDGKLRHEKVWVSGLPALMHIRKLGFNFLNPKP